jgi:DNA polymerase-1
VSRRTSTSPAIELRAGAVLSEDLRLRQAVEQGDAHTAIAMRLLNTAQPTRKQRAIAKTVNFAVLSGMGGEGLAHRLQITETDARAFVDRWWEAFPAVPVTSAHASNTSSSSAK